MKNRFFLFAVLGTWLLALALFGCSAGADSKFFGNGGGGSGQGTTTGTQSGTGGGGGCLLNCGTTGNGGGPINSLVIDPPSASLVVDNGNVPTQMFKAWLNGSDVTATVSWSYERPDIGDMAGATFKPTGTVGGMGKLTAKLNQSQGTATVDVTIKKTVNTAGITPQQQAAFDAPNGGPDSMSLLYPYDQTVFPLGVLAPEVQWNGGGGGDIYRIRFSEKYYSYTEFFTAAPPARHIVPQPDWDAVESSGAGAQSDPLTMEMERMSGATVYAPTTQTWHVAQGRLHGSVYYWELPDACGNVYAGRILRIKPDSTSVDQFYDAGTCFGCHTVSRDGKQLAAEFSDGNGPLGTLDLSANPVAPTGVSPGNFIFSAFNDVGDKLLASDNTASQPSIATLKVVDPKTGQTLNPNAMGNGCGEPAWSPDGKKVAGICGLDGYGWVFDSNSGYLAIGDVAADGFSVTNVHSIVPQAPDPGRPAYPSFSPGSEWLAFGRPTYGSRSINNGDLWIVAPDGSGLKKLATASNDYKSFNPVFAPLRAGGYFWIVFITKRDYGNTLVGANRQQLWVTAIDDPPSAADPSHPPFYMRGQENCGKSENAYYALDPCKAIGQDCTTGIDCCNGQCIKDPNTNQYVCGDPPPPGQCSNDGNSCKVTSDCCNPTSTCVDGFCTPPTPK